MEVLETVGPLSWAEQYVRQNWPIIPLLGKVPAVRRWQSFEASAADLGYWFGTRRCNMGLRTGESGYVVIDTDTAEADAWVREHLPETPMLALSGRGSRHRYFRAPERREIRNRQGWNGIQGLDIRGTGGYIVLPGSVHPDTGRLYEWLTDISRPSELPAFSPSWVPERTSVIRDAVARVLEPLPRLDQARAYLAKIEPAVSGSGGHTKTFTTALKLARIVEHDPEALWQLLCEYNARCEPPWSEKELRHKWEDALRVSLSGGATPRPS